MIELIFLLVFAVVVFSLLAPRDPRIKANPCPPHKWNSVEVKDPEGKTVMWKLICERCGPPIYSARKDEAD
jgi:hypothetical protein